jgi:hypothetical protein
MAKFYFNFRQGASYQVDDTGCEFGSVEEAYLSAFASAQDMWRELMIQRQDPTLCAFEIMDDQGRDLFVLPFPEVLDVCRGRTPRPFTDSTMPSHIHLALENRRTAQRVLHEVTSAANETRATLRETWDLLAQVGRIGVG